MGQPFLRSVSLQVVCLCLAVFATSCRDEQAGPRKRSGAGAGAPTATLKTLDQPPSNLTYTARATWAGGAVEYLGTQVTPARPRPGEPVQLAHYFIAHRPPPDYRFFAHVVDASTGRMVVNADHELQDGAAPLASWPVGKVIEDRHTVQLPQVAVPMRLVLGFWRGEERLPVDAPAAHDGTHRMLGPELSGAPAPLPEYRAHKRSGLVKVDGKLDDAAWAQAEEVTLVGSFDGRPTRLKTRAKVLYDDTHLYVGFEAEDPDVWGTLEKHDDPIYTQEVVELFVDADGDGRTYNELQVSPRNVTFDAAFVARRSNLDEAMKWESGFETAVHLRGTLNAPDDRDEGWSAELRIPLASLSAVPRVPPQAGDRWRFNLYRLESGEGRLQGEGHAFSPLFVGDFHHLPRFGWLVFE